MNAQEQTEWGRALWNMAAGIPEAKLLKENGWKVEVLNEGSGAIIDTESNVLLLRAERPGIFRRSMSPPAPVRHPLGYNYIPLGSEIKYKCGVAFDAISDETAITAEIFHRPVHKQRVPSQPPSTVDMAASALWAMRTVWNTICHFADAHRERKTAFRIVDGETPGRTVFVTCGRVVWHLRSENPHAFLRDPKRPEAWKLLPVDAAIDGTMTV